MRIILPFALSGGQFIHKQEKTQHDARHIEDPLDPRWGDSIDKKLKRRKDIIYGMHNDSGRKKCQL